MACFLIPAAEAVITTIAMKAVKNSENKALALPESKTDTAVTAVPLSKKLGWLNSMLWGGSALLAFEHVWHGEVTPWFPFLTAAADPTETAEMLHEMATAGVSMAVLVTAVWLGIVGVSHLIEKRAAAEPTEADTTEGAAS